MFIHDALNELIMCGETEIAATNLRTTINHLSTQIEGEKMSGFEHQFQVWTGLRLFSNCSRLYVRVDYPS